MITAFLQIQADTLSQAVNPAEVAANLPINTEISVLEFIFKGGFFHPDCHPLLLYNLSYF